MDIWQTPCSQLRPNAAIPFVSAGMSSYTRLVVVNLKKQRQEQKIKTDGSHARDQVVLANLFPSLFP
jgi:hypothetical protein